MIDNPDNKPFSRDDRDELAAVAAANARRNRPTHLVIAAAVLLVGSLAMAGSAYLSRGAASRALQRYQYENVQATALIARINEVRAQTSGAPGAAGENAPIGQYDPIPDILSRLIAISGRAGVSTGAPQESSQRPANGYVRKDYRYSATVPSPDVLMAWVRMVCEEVPGMQVLNIALTPNAAARTWAVNITFARLERVEN